MGPLHERTRPRPNLSPDLGANSGAENETKRLAGKVALITGTRGIARATAEAFAREGAAQIFVTHTGGKPRRVEELKAAIAAIGGGTEIIDVVCDVTSDDALNSLRDTIEARAGKLDILYHNAAGGLRAENTEAADDINFRAKVALTEKVGPLLAKSDDPVVVNIESTLSEYWGSDIKSVSDYDPVAKSKYKGKVELPKTVQALSEKNGTNIRYAEVCATGVEGTITWSLLSRAYPELVTNMLAGTEGESVNTHTVAEAIVKVASTDLPFGHTEYVGIPHWSDQEVAERLSMYSDASRKIDKIVFAEPGLSFGHYTVKPDDMLPHFNLVDGRLHHAALDRKASDPSEPDSTFIVTNAHVEGHFSGEGNPQILPGYKMFATAQETMTDMFNGLTGSRYHLSEVSDIQFKMPVFPGDKVDIYINPGGSGESELTYIEGAAQLRVGGTVVAEIGSMIFKPGEDPNDHLKPMVLESAALTTGLDAMHGGNIPENILPLFQGVKKITYAPPAEFGEKITKGTELVTQSRVGDIKPNGFNADAVTRVGLKAFATTSEIACGLEDRDKALRGLKILKMRRQRPPRPSQPSTTVFEEGKN